jgi:hypothetical protein
MRLTRQMLYGIQDGIYRESSKVKIAACVLALSAGVYSAAPADEPPSPVQPAVAQPPSVQAPAAGTASGAGEANPVEAKPADPKPADVKSPDVRSAPATTAGPAAKPDKTEVTAGVPTEAEIKQMRGRGFKPVTRNGTTVFCRAEGEIGTHFQRTRCSTLDELRAAELTGKEYVNSIQQQGSAVPFKGP